MKIFNFLILCGWLFLESVSNKFPKTYIICPSEGPDQKEVVQVSQKQEHKEHKKFYISDIKQWKPKTCIYQKSYPKSL